MMKVMDAIEFSVIIVLRGAIRCLAPAATAISGHAREESIEIKFRDVHTVYQDGVVSHV